MWIGRVIEGRKNVECRDRNTGLIRGLLAREADLARFEEQSDPLGEEGSESFDGILEVRLA